jgi:hypothetical protein
MDKGRAIISALQGAIDLNASTVAAPRGQGEMPGEAMRRSS